MSTLAPARPGSPYTGVGELIRLALRRDRIRLSVWIAVLTLMMGYAPNAVKLAYPDEPQRLARVELMKTPAGIIMGGPMFGVNQTHLGTMMANELMLTLIVATSPSIFTASRNDTLVAVSTPLLIEPSASTLVPTIRSAATPSQRLGGRTCSSARS